MTAQLALMDSALFAARTLQCPLRVRQACAQRPRERKTPRPVTANAYLMESFKPIVRSKGLKVTQDRRYRQGKRPQSIGASRLSDLEKQRPGKLSEKRDDLLIRWELEAAGVYAARPRVWRDCMPLRCPWCNAETRMATVPAESEEHQDGFACPQCSRPVAFVEAPDGRPAWVRRRAGDPIARDWAAYQRALNHAGPCGWLTCRHNVYSDVDEQTGMIKVNRPDEATGLSSEMIAHLRAAFPGLAIPARATLADLGTNIDQVPVSCSLAFAQALETEKGGVTLDEAATLEEVGVILNITQERTNQILREGVEQMRYGLAEFAEQ